MVMNDRARIKQSDAAWPFPAKTPKQYEPKKLQISHVVFEFLKPKSAMKLADQDQSLLMPTRSTLFFV